MAFENYSNYFEAANKHRLKSDNENAGRHYTLAAYELLGHSELERRDDLSMGIVCLMKSSICYRLDGDKRSCENRCQQGILVVEDADRRLYDAEPLHGVARELIGDFRIIGELGGHEADYEAARDVYEDYEDESVEWQTEDEFEVGISPFIHVAQAVGHEFDDYGRVRTVSLLARIEAKRDLFERLLAELDESGVWLWEENQS